MLDARTQAQFKANQLLALAAEYDNIFQKALTAEYGKKRAGDMRYRTAMQTPAIRQMGENYRTAIEAWRVAYRAIPEEAQS